MMPTLLGGVVLSYIAIDNMLEGPLRIFLKDYIDLKEFGSNIREEGLFYLILGLGIFQIIIALQSFIQPVIEINNGRIAIRTKEKSLSVVKDVYEIKSIEIIEEDKSKHSIIMENLLNEFDISHVRKSKSIVLSGGERRRLEIARTLATNPKYLLLDEPLTGIDPVSIEEIKIIIKKLKERNIGILITDHNVRETLKIVDKVYIVNEGAIFYSGDPLSAVNDERIKKFYLGSSFKL